MSEQIGPLDPLDQAGITRIMALLLGSILLEGTPETGKTNKIEGSGTLTVGDHVYIVALSFVAVREEPPPTPDSLYPGVYRAN
jgi:hypothetical protein